jgi:hypothetical protein
LKSLAFLFKLVSAIAAFGWVILIFAPNWKYANLFIINGIVVGLSVFYIYLLFIRKDISGAVYPKGNFTTLEGVTLLFKNPKNLLAGWVHYLAFDLMLGIYIKTEANALGINHFIQIPCFLLTFLLGPVGLLAFIIIQLYFK